MENKNTCESMSQCTTIKIYKKRIKPFSRRTRIDFYKRIPTPPLAFENTRHTSSNGGIPRRSKLERESIRGYEKTNRREEGVSKLRGSLIPFEIETRANRNVTRNGVKE